MLPERLVADVEVIVAAASEVGRTAMLKLASVVLDREDSVAVAQQPPPRLEAQEL